MISRRSPVVRPEGLLGTECKERLVSGEAAPSCDTPPRRSG